MDLRHDWKALNEVLFPNDNVGSSVAGGTQKMIGNSSVVLLESNGKVIDGVVSTGAPFFDVGLESLANDKTRLDEISEKYGVEKAVLLSKRDLDRYVVEAANLGTNYFQQLQLLREKVIEQGGKSQNKGPLVVSRRHFLLDLFGKHLRRFLPRRFNAVIVVDQRLSTAQGGVGAFSYRSILLSYSKGQLDQFFEPDFSSLHENRLVEWHKESQAIGQYLESRYLLPCFVIVMHKDVWEQCFEAASLGEGNPWRIFVRHYDAGRAAIYPRNILTKTLLAIQRMMVYFGRL